MENSSEIVAAIRQDGATLHDTPWGPIALDFGDWQGEYRTLRHNAGIFSPPAIAHIEITGSDRADFLNRLATNKLNHLQPGEGCETFLADSNGRILHHLNVFAGERSFVLQTGAGLGPALCSHLDYYLIREDVQIIDRSAQWGQLALLGPQAAGIIGRLATVNLPGDDVPICNVNVDWNGRPLMIRRLLDHNFPAFQVAGDQADMGMLWRSLRQLGAAPCGVRALETVRIEEGFPVIGLDITEKTLPQEVGRNEKAISFTKGCYLGQEIVARIDSRDAVKKVLSGIRFQTTETPTAGGELSHDGQAVGQITSAAFSPGFGQSIALAYVRRPHCSPGTQLDSPWGPAKVVELPMR